jgi:hypothetical protein
LEQSAHFTPCNDADQQDAKKPGEAAQIGEKEDDREEYDDGQDAGPDQEVLPFRSKRLEKSERQASFLVGHAARSPPG